MECQIRLIKKEDQNLIKQQIIVYTKYALYIIIYLKNNNIIYHYILYIIKLIFSKTFIVTNNKQYYG
jgi:hypothetical protein